MVRRFKRLCFELIRRYRLFHIVQDIRTYLESVEIQRGLDTVATSKVLVVSPHPDDESIGCGGTLALLAKSGKQIDVAFLTSGSPEGANEIKFTRESESRHAADILGLKNLFFLGGQDGQLHLQPWLSDPLSTLIKSGGYGLILCPWPYDGLPDHASAFQITKSALKAYDAPFQLWFYEVWSPLPATQLVDIDSTIDLKRDAINAHRSQVSNIDYTKKFLALASYRSLACRPALHAEAFMKCSKKDLYKIG